MREGRRLSLKLLFCLMFLLGFLSRALLAPGGFNYDRVVLTFLLIFVLMLVYVEKDKIEMMERFEEFVERETEESE